MSLIYLRGSKIPSPATVKNIAGTLEVWYAKDKLAPPTEKKHNLRLTITVFRKTTTFHVLFMPIQFFEPTSQYPLPRM